MKTTPYQLSFSHEIEEVNELLGYSDEIRAWSLEEFFGTSYELIDRYTILVKLPTDQIRTISDIIAPLEEYLMVEIEIQPLKIIGTNDKRGI